MITAILERWSFMRILRLAMGVWLIVESLRTDETMFSILGGLFVFQALMNVSCIGGNCDVPAAVQRRATGAEETTFEEIK
ncbi:MAG: hypothetical protein JNL70_18705 [Saprospiraceae bacterium]|nr:hypothetical protein [Saprospiraceae bacterium]